MSLRNLSEIKNQTKPNQASEKKFSEALQKWIVGIFESPVSEELMDTLLGMFGMVYEWRQARRYSYTYASFTDKLLFQQKDSKILDKTSGTTKT